MYKNVFTLFSYLTDSSGTILKEVSPECSLERLVLKLQYFGHLIHAKNWLIGKDPDPGKDWRQEEKGTTEDEMNGWHHRLNGHGFEQALGVGDGQGGLACFIPWGCEESDTTELLDWTDWLWYNIVGCKWLSLKLWKAVLSCLPAVGLKSDAVSFPILLRWFVLYSD